MNKYWTSVRNTQMQRIGIEVFGGNGTIETFSSLPRLYRDAMVTESWEGTHNVLCAQLHRDMGRYELHRPFLSQLEMRIAASAHPLKAVLRQRCGALLAQAALIAADRSESATVAMRTWIDQAMVTYQALCLVELAASQRDGGTEPLPDDVVALLLHLHPMRRDAERAVWWPSMPKPAPAD